MWRYVGSEIFEAITEQPLPIYVVDPQWKPVVERFVAEYGKPSEAYSK